VYTPFQRETQILNESGETVEYVYSESLGNYVMVPSSVIQRECNPGYVGDVKHPVTALAFGRPLCCGSQSVSSASFVSGNIPVVN